MAVDTLSARHVQLLRVGMFLLIMALIHRQHAVWQRAQRTVVPDGQMMAIARQVFSEADGFVQPATDHGPTEIVDAAGDVVGLLVRTSPQSDHIVGFSGPTDVLLIADSAGAVQAVEVLSSRDTRDHVRQVVKDPNFLPSLNQQTLHQPDAFAGLDAVSGATLTSLAMLESIRYRLAVLDGNTAAPAASLRFPKPIALEAVQQLFSTATAVRSPSDTSGLWQATDEKDNVVGHILRSSPAADNITGYQGPTETLVGIDLQDRVVGIVIGESYDNEPYTDYVREDDYFRSRFNDQTLAALAEFDLQEARIEGVSGATMTSMAVAEGIVAAAIAEASRRQRQAAARPTATTPPWDAAGLWTPRNLSTLLIAALGAVLGLTHLRRSRRLRLVFQLIVIVWLGLLNGDMLSTALMLGWAQSGIAWSNALGLTFLSLSALVLPVATGQNVYCSHVCPHGAVQQLIRNRLPWRMRLTRRSRAVLKCIPFLLVVWVCLIGLLHLPMSAVDVEPFDAWVFRIAGAATISVAVIGLLVSAFVPMAYCRYGCPTGAILGFLRTSRRDRFGRQDWCAAVLVLIGLVCVLST
jgi:NosR/NirI family nitrous oxide reductase transcriptional regulator